jgi:hypothetical protein
VSSQSWTMAMRAGGRAVELDKLGATLAPDRLGSDAIIPT